jgi:4-hydroxy-tetrahydrodipicolinate reductase
MSAPRTRLAVAGATGRLGRRIVALAASERVFCLSSALTGEGSPLVGRDAGECAGLAPLGLPVESTPSAPFDVLIDASVPAALARWLELCVERRAALVIAATGHSTGARAAIEAASRSIPILQAANLGLGANLLRRLAAELGRALGPAFDVEVAETHHREKRDRPSGTALELSRALEEVRGASPPIQSSRLGAVVGEHSVRFVSAEEELVVLHRAFSRDAFARGALRAASWLVLRSPGLYRVDDLLGDSSLRPR